MNRSINIIFLSLLFLTKAFSAAGQEKADSFATMVSMALTQKTNADTSDIEKIFIANGLVDIQSIDSSFQVDLIYSSNKNFIGIDFYGTLSKAYFQKDVAEKLVNAKKILEKEFPHLRMKIYDATRPLSIQQMMWDSIKIPGDQKEKFLANPKFGSLHNYGAAVDLVLLDTTGKTIDMGTEFDSFEKLSYPLLEEHFLKTKELSEKQHSNRLILRNAMKKAGFNHIPTEWWHFSTCSRDEAAARYAMIIHHKLPESVKAVDLIAEENREEKIIEGRINKNINIVFKVQLASSSAKLPRSHQIFKIKTGKIEEYYHEGNYKYTIGSFKDIGEAHEYQFKMRELGYTDAFVAGFNNNERISIHDAIELMQFQ